MARHKINKKGRGIKKLNKSSLSFAWDGRNRTQTEILTKKTDFAK